jgi:hypothetical protein
MKALCTVKFFDGQQLYEDGKEYEVPKGFENRFAIPQQKQLIENAKPTPAKPAAGK